VLFLLADAGESLVVVVVVVVSVWVSGMRMKKG
jgi:hypothetical protein